MSTSISTCSTPDRLRSTSTALRWGLSGSELSNLLEVLLRDSHVDAVSLTAYDPDCDPDARVPPIAARLLSLVGEHVEGDGD